MRRANKVCHKREGSLEQGAVLVEMAFALPLLALIFLNIIDLGLMVRQYQVLQNAAREGARISVYPRNQLYYHDPVHPCDPSDAIKQTVVSYCLQEKIVIGPSDVTINQVYPLDPLDPLAGGCGSEITVSYARPLLFLGAPLLPTGSWTLTGRAVFSNFYACTPSTYPTGVVCQ